MAWAQWVYRIMDEIMLLSDGARQAQNWVLPGSGLLTKNSGAPLKAMLGGAGRWADEKPLSTANTLGNIFRLRGAKYASGYQVIASLERTRENL